METGNLLSIFSAPSIFGVDALIGKNCDPFFAFGGGKCEAKPVCCSETSAVRPAFLTICVSFHLFILTGRPPRRRMPEP